ncbi:MAG: LysR family transcriptional regulator [Woeseiaceae bacterium]|nr:LysR family transcriptional regulator [Woeseiaceae bacterium]
MYRELPDLYLFAKVAETLSLREAALQLQLARSTVSKRLSRFEKELGVKLFNRSTRRISLTDSGRRLYQQWHDVSRSIDSALATVRDADQILSGTLRVNMPSSLGSALMPDLMGDFRRQCPDLKLSIDFFDQHVDVVGQGYDVVIRTARRLPDSRLIARRLASSPRILAASPQYIERHGQPRKLEDLRDHHCLALGRQSERQVVWSFDSNNGPVDISLNPAFAANNELALVLAACLGVGILYTPKILIENELQLERLRVLGIRKYEWPSYGLYAIYPKENPSAKVKAFVDFVERRLGSLATADRWAPLMRAPKAD